MNKRLLPIIALLLCSAAITFACVSWLLREFWLFAAALLAMLFIGGLWLPGCKPGTLIHASWLGLAIGAFLASIAFMSE